MLAKQQMPIFCLFTEKTRQTSDIQNDETPCGKKIKINPQWAPLEIGFCN